MGVGRKRITHKHLPPRVYRRHGAFYYVDHKGKWHRLGATDREMYEGLARLTGELAGTMRDHFERYRKEILPNKAPSTQKEQGRQLVILEDVFGEMLPAEVLPRHVAQFLRQYGAPVQANRITALLSDVFGTMLSWWLVDGLDRNPCQGVKRNPEKPRDRYVDDGEFWAVWQLAPRYVQLAMELALVTGLRRGIVLRLSEKHLRDDGIHVDAGKRGKKLILEWTPRLRAVVSECQAEGVRSLQGWLIRQPNGQRIATEAIKSAWQRLMVKAEEKGIERFTFHDIRAKSATDHDDGEHLGHRDKRTLERVYRRKPEKVRGL